MEEKVTLDDVKRYGPIVCRLFSVRYPDGADYSQLREDEKNHGWIRRMLADMDRRAVNERG